MTDVVSILTPAQLCRTQCPWLTIPAGPGYVRRCPHGQIWIYNTHILFTLDPCRNWRRLRAWIEPFRYRRAVRALTPAVDKTVLPPPPPSPPAPKPREGRPR